MHFGRNNASHLSLYTAGVTVRQFMRSPFGNKKVNKVTVFAEVEAERADHSCLGKGRKRRWLYDKMRCVHNFFIG
jgi:hypothetical protein